MDVVKQSKSATGHAAAVPRILKCRKSLTSRVTYYSLQNLVLKEAWEHAYGADGSFIPG